MGAIRAEARFDDDAPVIPDFCIWPDSIVRTKMLTHVWLSSQIKPIKVLDVGCGRAALWGTFLKHVANVKVFGFDPSAASIEVARKNAPVGALSLTCGDVRQLGTLFAEEGEFDVIVSHSVLEHVVPRQEFLSGVCDRLAPGGKLVLSWGSDHFKQGARTTARNYLSQWLARIGIEQYYAKEVDDDVVLDFLRRRHFAIDEFSYHSIVSVKKCVKSLRDAEAQLRCHSLWRDLEVELNRTIPDKSVLKRVMDEALVIARKL